RMTALDGASGSFKWSASPERIYAVHGGYLLVDAEAITEYRFTGETKWQADLGASGIVRAHAQAEGHTVVSICRMTWQMLPNARWSDWTPRVRGHGSGPSESPAPTYNARPEYPR